MPRQNIIDYYPIFSGVIQASDGILYGTSQLGGTNDLGTIFKLSTNGAAFSLLWRFTGTNGDGRNPMTALVETRDGLLFGTTRAGGASNQGTIFKLNKDGSSYAVAHNFTYSTNDGGFPNTLIQGKDLFLYGTTQSGGISNAGTVFKLNSDGTGYGLARSFVGSPNDGRSPVGALATFGGLLEGADGLLYGTTYFGGQFGLGTLFRLAKYGSLYSVLRHFIYWPADGVNARTSLMEASDGALYGTTDYDGVNVPGTVFRLNKGGGGYSMLARFTSYANGPLWEGTNGALYGLTQNYAVMRSFESIRMETATPS